MRNYKNVGFDIASFGVCLESALMEVLMTTVKLLFFHKALPALNSLPVSVLVYIYGPVSLKTSRSLLASS